MNFARLLLLRLSRIRTIFVQQQSKQQASYAKSRSPALLRKIDCELSATAVISFLHVCFNRSVSSCRGLQLVHSLFLVQSQDMPAHAICTCVMIAYAVQSKSTIHTREEGSADCAAPQRQELIAIIGIGVVDNVSTLLIAQWPWSAHHVPFYSMMMGDVTHAIGPLQFSRAGSLQQLKILHSLFRQNRFAGCIGAICKLKPLIVAEQCASQGCASDPLLVRIFL